MKLVMCRLLHKDNTASRQNVTVNKKALIRALIYLT